MSPLLHMKRLAAAAALTALTGTAQAALVLQSNGLEVLDTDTSLLWLVDWDSSGYRTWVDAKAWAAGLTTGGATAGDWRLPEIDEYGELWTDPDIGESLGGLKGRFQFFTSLVFWSATAPAPNSLDAWSFSTGVGIPSLNARSAEIPAAAVRRWNEVTPVPEPQTLALTLLALGASVASRRVRRRRERDREAGGTGVRS